MSAARMILKSSGARYVASQGYAPAGNTQALTLSAFKASDFVMIFATYVSSTSSITGGAGGWTSDSYTWLTYGYTTVVFRKNIVAADIAAGVTFNNPSGGGGANVVVVGYRGGVSAAARKSVAQSSNTADATLSLTGFTKSLGCRRVVGYAVDRDPDAAPGPPAAYFTRKSANRSTFFAATVADVPPSRFTNGAPITWTGFDIVNLQTGMAYELT